MKVKDLIARLQEFDENLDIITTWEGITVEIDRDSIYLGNRTYNRYGKEPTGDMVFIDADENSYKEDWQKGREDVNVK